MLAYAVVDPECVSEDVLRAAGCLSNCEELFRSVAEDNAVLLGDLGGCLRQELVDAIGALPSDVGQYLQAYLASILSAQRVRFLERQQCGNGKVSRNERVRAAAGAAFCDAVWVRDSASYACDTQHVKPKVRSVHEYLRSDFEKFRRSLRGPHAPIHTLPRGRFEELIARSVVGSRWLRFFERHIGLAAGDRRVRQFAAGIAYVVALWCKACPGEPLEVEVYSLTPKPDQAHPAIVAENENALRVVTAELVAALPDNVSVSVELKYGKDSFHARYLESELTAVAFDSGFDFVKSDRLQNNIIKWDDNSAYLDQVRRLPGIRSPSQRGAFQARRKRR